LVFFFTHWKNSPFSSPHLFRFVSACYHRSDSSLVSPLSFLPLRTLFLLSDFALADDSLDSAHRVKFSKTPSSPPFLLPYPLLNLFSLDLSPHTSSPTLIPWLYFLHAIIGGTKPLSPCFPPSQLPPPYFTSFFSSFFFLNCNQDSSPSWLNHSLFSIL